MSPTEHRVKGVGRHVRQLTYRVRAGGKGYWRKQGTPADILLGIPYFRVFHPPLLPPHRVINAVFREGHDRSGLSNGIRWRPFELTRGEYRLLTAELRTRLPGLVQPLVPRWVRTPRDWHLFVMRHVLGVPLDSHRRLLARLDRLSRAATAARRRRHFKRARDLSASAGRVGNELVVFLEPYFEANKAAVQPVADQQS